MIELNIGLNWSNRTKYLFLNPMLLFQDLDGGIYMLMFFFRLLVLSEYQCKWEVFPLMGMYILIGVYATPLMRGVIITYE